MRLNRLLTILAASAAFSLTAGALAAAASTAPAAASAPESRAAAIATGVAQLTGLAISPLLVLVTIGWIDFARAGGSAAPALALHASPWLLVPCSIVLGLVLTKRLATPAIPLPIRKLLDAAEYLEAKASALVAAGVLVPSIVLTLSAAAGDGAAPAQAAGIASDWAASALIVPLAILVFAAVWLTFHMVDALIVLSPFAVLDVALAGARFAVLAVVGLALIVSPFLAVALCVPIIAASLLFAGWCVRLDLFALTVATDILLVRRRMVDPRAPMRGFLASRGLGAPIRTMGRLEPVDGGLVFRYRPFFVLPRRSIALAPQSPVLVRGAVWSTLQDDAERRRLVALPPRYTAHHEAVCARLRATARDGMLRATARSLGDAWRSLRDAIASIPGPADAAAGPATPQ